MQGAGNDFIVLNATQTPLDLDTAVFKKLADRHFGIGADQILIIGPSPAPEVDFSYRIINADGSEVEQCGNGARCFMRYVIDHQLTTKTTIKVRTSCGDIVLQLQPDQSITVNMGAPVFDLERIPFIPADIQPLVKDHWRIWPLPLELPPHTPTDKLHPALQTHPTTLACAVVSMGNPHAVIHVDDVDMVAVDTLGSLVESHPCFPQHTNVGFMQILSRSHIKIRVYERGVGETLACGTGICAAVVTGIRMGWLDEQVYADARGGTLRVNWAGISKTMTEPVWMNGPAHTVFEGVIEL